MSTLWSEIPMDLLHSILSQLSIPDIFRSAAVCSHWSAAVDKLRRRPADQHPQIPWLVPDNQFLVNGKYNDRNTHNFFSLSEGREYYIPSEALRRIRGEEVIGAHPPMPREVIGSSHGWLMTAGDVHVQLENPITGKLIELPSIPTMDGRKLYAIEAALSSDPSRCGDYIVVFVFFSYSKQRYFLFFFRAGNENWTMIISEGMYHFENMHFHKSKLYTVSQTGEDGQMIVAAYDLIQPDSSTPATLELVLPWGVNFYTRILCTPSGDLLIVRITMVANPSGHYGLKLKIWKANTEKEEIVRVKDLGKYALFLGTSASYLCLDTSSLPDLKSNSIYISGFGYNVVYNVEDKSFASLNLPSTASESTKWKHKLTRPVLVWFTPNCAC